MLLAKGKITQEMIAMLSKWRHYGYYSNFSRGKRQKEGNGDAIPCILESQGDAKTFRREWVGREKSVSSVKEAVDILTVSGRTKGMSAGRRKKARQSLSRVRMPVRIEQIS
ncbi:MAG: hypothetical protein WCW53_05090 [Syntrophales bacterium]